jgi:ABC-2 type transport system ATP-binding protein
MIVFEGVTKVYQSRFRRRSVCAVDDFSLTVRRGEMFGIAGPNGAGKSTLINLILGFLRPTQGRVTLDGLPPRGYVESRGVGYLSELVSIPPTWNVTRALERYATLGRIPADRRADRIESVMERLGLGEHRNKRVKHLSKGNLQRLGLAQALLNDSEVVILDEPSHGLDPIWTQRSRDIMQDLRRAGCTAVVASHNLDELERIADRVGIIDKGRLESIASIGSRSSEAAAEYRLVLAEPHHAVVEVFPGAARAEGAQGEYLLPATEIDALNVGIARLIAAGARIVAIMPQRSRLEVAFRAAIGAQQ